MSRDRGALIGRNRELEAVDEFAGRSALVVVRGDAGMGKTTLLGEVHRSWRARGIAVVRVRFPAGDGNRDEYGARLTLEAFRNIFHEIGDARVGAAMTAVSRRCGPGSGRSPEERAALFADLVRLLRSLRAAGPVAVLADDVHNAQNPVFAVAAARQAECTVLATCRADGAGELTSLGEAADRVLDLAPLPADGMDELLAAAAPGPLDRTVAPALRAALGSLSGNPGTGVATVELLGREGRFTEVHGYLCLSGRAGPVPLPDEHELVRAVARQGDPGRRLVALTAGLDRFGIDDLPVFAAATGDEVVRCGNAVDSLVAAGALACDDEGVLSVPCPALATAVLAGMGRTEVAGLHRAIADHLLRDGRAQAAEPAALADHIALAGGAPAPDPAVVVLLTAEAGRKVRVAPELAARWYRAALRHSAPGSATRGGILTTLLRLLVRIAGYECLGEVVAEVVAVGVEDHQRYELAASAALAAIHTGRPVPDPVSGALAGDPAARRPLEFAARWFTRYQPFDQRELVSAFTAFREGGEPDPGAPGPRLSGDQYDVVALLKLVLGEGYGEPVSGPLAIHARIVRNYLDGKWEAIPADVRQLELAGPACTAITEKTRLVAGEVLSSVSDFTRAAQLVEPTGGESPFPALRGWVEMGLAYRAGDYERARAIGWAAYDRIAEKAEQGSYVGLRSFLVRLAYLERDGGDAGRLQRACAEAKRWNARLGGPGPRVAELIVRGLAENDYAAAKTAVELLRAEGNLAELMRACLTAAFIADEPRPWYHEAYDIAKRLGGDWMRLYVKASMRYGGVAPPRARGGSELLSETEERIVVLVRQGLTNRQISNAIGASEKAVENALTRLFAKTGCRSRLDLATASLDGRLAAAGNDGRGAVSPS